MSWVRLRDVCVSYQGLHWYDAFVAETSITVVDRDVNHTANRDVNHTADRDVNHKAAKDVNHTTWTDTELHKVTIHSARFRGQRRESHGGRGHGVWDRAAIYRLCRTRGPAQHGLRHQRERHRGVVECGKGVVECGGFGVNEHGIGVSWNAVGVSWNAVVNASTRTASGCRGMR